MQHLIFSVRFFALASPFVLCAASNCRSIHLFDALVDAAHFSFSSSVYKFIHLVHVDGFPLLTLDFFFYRLSHSSNMKSACMQKIFSWSGGVEHRCREQRFIVQNCFKVWKCNVDLRWRHNFYIISYCSLTNDFTVERTDYRTLVQPWWRRKKNINEHASAIFLFWLCFLDFCSHWEVHIKLLHF